ncbi:Alpha/beta hydrolase [Phaffia rhodozyma]|uniref:Alpha/beta hydrolase n=1 Tax=Phaffia rhodozyma TaxID=264483 RepID=A0A0F7SU63_PHARH|nr:Alpha/beta hydrolase [Phaffia rhodozyma]
MLFERSRGLFRLLRDMILPSPKRKSIIIIPGPADPEMVNVHRVGSGKEIESISVHDWIRDSCPSLRGIFKPSWWLWSGDLQTIYNVLGNFTLIDPVTYSRTLLETVDNGTLGLDFVVNSFTPAEDTPVLIIAHGLTGGSYESYVRNVMAHATKDKVLGGLGLRGVVVNFRGCADVPVTSAQLYSAGYTDDFRTAVLHISQKYPNAPLLGCGFSLGAGVLARFVAEEGAHCILKSATVVSAPWDCPGMSARLDATFFSRQVYSRSMGTNILNIFNKIIKSPASAEIFAHPESRIARHIAFIKKMWRPTLRETDEVVVSTVGGSPECFPFPNAEAYYQWASPQNKLHQIAIPTLCISAFDDPIIPGDMLPIEKFSKSSHAVLAVIGGGEGKYVGFKIKEQDEGGGPFKWVAKKRVFVDV